MGYAHRSVAGLVAVAFTAGICEGAVSLGVTASGLPSINLSPGESVAVGIILTSDTPFAFNSAIFRVRFSEPGLTYLGYSWTAPFATRGMFDDSDPSGASLPMTITSSSHLDPASPPEEVDLMFSNAAFTSFSGGLLVTLMLAVPENAPPGIWRIEAVPDTFALGFTLIGVDAGPGLDLVVVPAPGAAFAVGILVLLGHRSRRSVAGLRSR